MKSRLLTFVLLVFASTTVLAQPSGDKWPAINALHMIIAETFHPAEDGNFAPIRTRSQELLDKSSALLKSDIPAEYRTNSILNTAEKIQLKSKAIHKLVVAKASDADLFNALTELHNYFHEIVGLCTDNK